ncbi:MAG: DUF4258 domain-containing protein [Nanoarchaeota archaeon]
MDLILTKHAKQKMIERDISIEEVQNTIELPDYTINKGDKIESYKKENNKNLKVGYSIRGKFIKIVTVIIK